MSHTYGVFIFVPIHTVSIFHFIVQRLGHLNVCGATGTFYPEIFLFLNPLAIAIILGVYLLIMFGLVVMPLNFYPSVSTTTGRQDGTSQKN